MSRSLAELVRVHIHMLYIFIDVTVLPYFSRAAPHVLLPIMRAYFFLWCPFEVELHLLLLFLSNRTGRCLNLSSSGCGCGEEMDPRFDVVCNVKIEAVWSLIWEKLKELMSAASSLSPPSRRLLIPLHLPILLSHWCNSPCKYCPWLGISICVCVCVYRTLFELPRVDWSDSFGLVGTTEWSPKRKITIYGPPPSQPDHMNCLFFYKARLVAWTYWWHFPAHSRSVWLPSYWYHIPVN